MIKAVPNVGMKNERPRRTRATLPRTSSETDHLQSITAWRAVSGINGVKEVTNWLLLPESDYRILRPKLRWEPPTLRPFRCLETPPPPYERNAMRKYPVMAALTLLTLAVTAEAWNHFGHMTVAAIAYERLTPKARKAVDELLRHNPLYKAWVKGVAAHETQKVAFIRAATWPDLIKDPALGYQNDGNLPTGPEASRNIGYSDRLMHRYWHFIDVPFSPDNTDLPALDVPNAQTQIATFRATLTDPQASKDLQSYGLV